MEVIANTTIVSNFAAVGQLGLLRDVLGRVFISTEVYAEIQDGLRAMKNCGYSGNCLTLCTELRCRVWQSPPIAVGPC
jgi:predicted nucleic acid-binding protein